jgi:hypothetical protein
VAKEWCWFREAGITKALVTSETIGQPTGTEELRATTVETAPRLTLGAGAGRRATLLEYVRDTEG